MKIGGFKSYIKLLLLPAFLIAVVIVILGITIKGQNDATRGAIYGLVFGVLLGFSVDMLKRGLDSANKENLIRKTARKILGQDAKDIFTTTWLYKSLIESPKVPDEVKRQLPPEFKLRYWQRIKDDKEFLLLASDKWFHEVYEIFFNIEEINDQIKLAKTGNQQAYQFAHGFYHLFMEEDGHKELLSKFMSDEEVESFEGDLKAKNKKAGTRKSS